MNDKHPVDQTDATPELDTYEPPRVEHVLTADDLAREIQYAGTISQQVG